MDNFGHIPRDVIIEILSRLPVKSLLRFKCVCKSWRSIITGHSFIYEHLNMALVDCKRARLLIMHIDPHTRATVFSLFTNEQLKAPKNLRFHTKPQGHFRIMGPCHGLFCLYDYYENFFLWNPATREIKDMPKTPIRLSREFVHKPNNALYGFGFDLKTRDYKVVKMLWSDYKDGVGEYRVYVYTLSTNSWRKIDVALLTRVYYSFSYYNSAYVNGTYYWWARLFIVCFDISNEQLWMIRLPKLIFPPMEGDVRASTTFNEYNGSLAVFFFLQNETETCLNCGHWIDMAWQLLGPSTLLLDC
ncbi:F-box kelch-repeat At3g23880-like [Olea europaea subsp. europaea]|uniref:F-box kelch-repeat At3g23880-like n=1 Tax=Olea europaea subsp. europaea TaxID=158383 RepID=A0A8S0VL06_OLEEU|nr:F-box kelch-repeat At3g23880-like [Olea europaea subsp. europaea]